MVKDNEGQLIDPPVIPEYEQRMIIAQASGDLDAIDEIQEEYADAREKRVQRREKRQASETDTTDTTDSGPIFSNPDAGVSNGPDIAAPENTSDTQDHTQGDHTIETTPNQEF